MRSLCLSLLCLMLVAVLAGSAGAQSLAELDQQARGSEVGLGRVLLLRDYNTRVVVIGTMLLGLASGVVGTFMLLRKRALVGDALSHATLPGIAGAFMLMTLMGWDGKSLVGLLIGAVVSSVLGVGCIVVIRRYSRLKDDAAMGIVLSVFFGVGVALLGVIQTMRQGNAAGLESFIYGKTASMLAADAWLIGVTAGVVILVGGVLFKEFGLLCFDESFAGAQGWPVLVLDVVMMGLVVVTTVIGLQAVGLILMVALLVIPPAAARFWTDNLRATVLVAALIGAGSGLVGSLLSAIVPDLPAGAVIVTVASGVFLLSLVFGPARGVLARWLAHVRLSRKVAWQHLLRAMYELAEGGGDGGDRVTRADRVEGRVVELRGLAGARSWSARGLRRVLGLAERRGWVRRMEREQFALTGEGAVEAARVMRNHRLWEMYLITHADIAPSHVDRDADQIEHVLGRDLVERLSEMVSSGGPATAVPPSPHAVAGV